MSSNLTDGTKYSLLVFVARIHSKEFLVILSYSTRWLFGHSDEYFVNIKNHILLERITILILLNTINVVDVEKS